ncbi:MAG: hypothetical protein ACYC2O_10375, partial [Microthrixaceae bacterium]
MHVGSVGDLVAQRGDGDRLRRTQSGHRARERRFGEAQDCAHLDLQVLCDSSGDELDGLDLSADGEPSIRELRYVLDGRSLGEPGTRDELISRYRRELVDRNDVAVTPHGELSVDQLVETGLRVSA